MTTSEAARPNRWPWPPMLLAVAALVAIVLGTVLPWPLGIWAVWPGYGLTALGIGVDGWAILTMYNARTNVLPNRGADVLVTWGPFRFSRNPIYLANTMLLIGVGLAFGNAWFVPLAFVTALLVDRLAIRREERHLAIRFGTAWLTYAAATPRWLIK